MLSKVSVEEVVMQYFRNTSPASGSDTHVPTGALPLDPAGGLLSFRPLIAHPLKKSCERA